MRLTCPSCGAVHSLDAAIGHEAAREAVLRALERDALGRRIVRYLGLFRSTSRALSWERTARLLGELLDMIDAARVTRRGRVWAAPADAWRAALDVVLAARDAGTLRLPLSSHAYLVEVVAGLADRAEAQIERAGEDRAAGRTPVGLPSPSGRGQGEGERPPTETAPPCATRSPSPQPAPAGRGRTAMPASIRETLKQITTQQGKTHE